MGRTAHWPPRLTRKARTTEARLYYRGRWYTCGKWDVASNRPSEAAKREHAELVSLWTEDPEAVPGHETPLVDLLVAWLKSQSSPAGGSDRKWIAVVIRRLGEWCADSDRHAIAACEFSFAEAEVFQTWLCMIAKDELPEDRKRRWQSRELGLTLPGDPHYSRRSIAKVMKFITQAVGWASKNNKFEVSRDQHYDLLELPAPKTGRVREPKTTLPATWKDLNRVCKHSHEQLAAILKLLWWTGARPGELLGLRVEDVQRSGTLTIPKVPPIKLGEVWAAHVKSKMSRTGHCTAIV